MFTVWTSEKLKELSITEKFMLENSGMPKIRWTDEELLVTDDNREAYSRLTQIRNSLYSFVRSSTNNLVICGKSTGNGKTTWANKLMLTYIEQNCHRLDNVPIEDLTVDKHDMCLFCLLVPFLVELKMFGNNSESTNLYHRLCKSEFVVLDDLGAVPMTQYDYNAVYGIIEHRLDKGLPTVITTNFTSLDSLQSEIGPRLAERIWSNSEIVNIKSSGFRGVR
jgi:DNA replication protein DnaC